MFGELTATAAAFSICPLFIMQQLTSLIRCSPFVQNWERKRQYHALVLCTWNACRCGPAFFICLRACLVLSISRCSTFITIAYSWHDPKILIFAFLMHFSWYRRSTRLTNVNVHDSVTRQEPNEISSGSVGVQLVVCIHAQQHSLLLSYSNVICGLGLEV